LTSVTPATAGGVFTCSGFLVRIIYRAAQLHNAFDSLDFDFERLHRVVGQEGALHLGCDDRIVHELTRAVSGGCRLAAAREAANRECARQGEQESKMSMNEWMFSWNNGVVRLGF